MPGFLNDIRCVNKKSSVCRQAADTIGILLLGIALGVISKYLDGTASNSLPYIMEYLDVTNFLGRFAIWMLTALCISVYSASPVRAGINVFVFFTGMVVSYYLYSTFIAGFFSVSYAMIWVAFTIISPALAFVCWYAKGDGMIAVMISGVILGILFSQAFLITQGFYVTHFLEVLTWMAGVIILFRKPKEFAIEMGLSFVVAFLYQSVVPYWG